MYHLLSSRHTTRLLAAMILFVGLGFGACSMQSEPPGVTRGPLPSNEYTEEPGRPSFKDRDPFFGQQPTEQPPKYVPVTHLAPCSAATDCGGRVTPTSGEQSCQNLLGDPLCFYPCDPKKGTGEVQNPDCIQPENCLELSSGGGQTVGYCIYIPGQLYGSGSYKAVIRHKQGTDCLIRYGGCDNGLLCVDIRGRGSIGTCEFECIPTTDDAENRRRCENLRAGTTCKRLASGFGACLP